MYILVMTIDHYYWKCDHKCHHARQVEKEVLESHSKKQGKASTSGPATVSQNKTNLFLAASSTKISSSKPSLSPVPKKQFNSLWVDLSSKLASNSKLTSNECKKYLKNNPKKQTTVTSKSYALATASKKTSEK